MARPKEFDPDEALAAAMEKFWERGYEATSLADITACTGVQKASLYATYGDKRTLFVTALARYQVEGRDRLRTALNGSGSVRAAIEAVLTSAVKDASAKERGRGCLCVNTAIEIGARDPEIAAMLASHSREAEALFEQALDRGKVRGEFAARLDSATTGRFLLCTLYGLHVGGKGGMSGKKLKDVVGAALAILAP